MKKYLFLICLFPLSINADFFLYPPPLTSNPNKIISYWIYTVEEYLKENEVKFSNIENFHKNIPFNYGYSKGFLDAMKLVEACLVCQEESN